MRFEAQWLVQGYFRLSDQQEPLMPAIRDKLCEGLGLPSGGLNIQNYPTGPKFKHTYWWREQDKDYVEAQFFARIAQDYPVLSLGISVEKGLEDRGAIPSGRKDTSWMDRSVWDWSSLVRSADRLLSVDMPACGHALRRPVFFRVSIKRFAAGQEAEHESKTYTCCEGTWFERHTGGVGEKEIVRYIEMVDARRDCWVDSYLCCDFSPSEADGLTVAASADILLTFRPVRQRLRARR